jgi:hypothetical protein
MNRKKKARNTEGRPINSLIAFIFRDFSSRKKLVLETR